jgi:hypothetical protein
MRNILGCQADEVLIDDRFTVPNCGRSCSLVPLSSDTPHQPPGPSMEGFVELREKTRDLRKCLMATTVLVDASVATHNEWLSVVTDYVGPQLNHISGKFLDHQVRNYQSPIDHRLPTCLRVRSFESLSLRMGCHRHARAPFFANDTLAG